MPDALCVLNVSRAYENVCYVRYVCILNLSFENGFAGSWVTGVIKLNLGDEEFMNIWVLCRICYLVVTGLNGKEN